MRLPSGSLTRLSLPEWEAALEAQEADPQAQAGTGAAVLARARVATNAESNEYAAAFGLASPGLAASHRGLELFVVECSSVLSPAKASVADLSFACSSSLERSSSSNFMTFDMPVSFRLLAQAVLPRLCVIRSRKEVVSAFGTEMPLVTGQRGMASAAVARPLS